MKFPPCPNCKKKGLRYANHPHAQGWKDYNKANCRYCGKTFKLKERSVAEVAPPQIRTPVLD